MSTTKLDSAKRTLRAAQHIPESDYLCAVFARGLVDPQDDQVLFVNADGHIVERATRLVPQAAPTAKTTSSTLTAAQLLTGIITVAQGAGAASAQQLPTGTALDTALPHAAAGDAFDFSVINISTTDAEDASITVNTGVTIVGSANIPAFSTSTNASLNSSGRFRCRKTDTATWVVYRIA